MAEMMADKQTVAGKVAGFIATNFIFDEETKLEPDASLLDTGIIDSTGVIELVTYLEEEFGITIEDRELVPDNLDSINRIAVFVSGKTGS
jgi:acyl carrier protein